MEIDLNTLTGGFHIARSSGRQSTVTETPTLSSSNRILNLSHSTTQHEESMNARSVEPTERFPMIAGRHTLWRAITTVNTQTTNSRSTSTVNSTPSVHFNTASSGTPVTGNRRPQISLRNIVRRCRTDGSNINSIHHNRHPSVICRVRRMFFTVNPEQTNTIDRSSTHQNPAQSEQLSTSLNQSSRTTRPDILETSSTTDAAVNDKPTIDEGNTKKPDKKGISCRMDNTNSRTNNILDGVDNIFNQNYSTGASVNDLNVNSDRTSECSGVNSTSATVGNASRTHSSDRDVENTSWGMYRNPGRNKHPPTGGVIRKESDTSITNVLRSDLNEIDNTLDGIRELVRHHFRCHSGHRDLFPCTSSSKDNQTNPHLRCDGNKHQNIKGKRFSTVDHNRQSDLTGGTSESIPPRISSTSANVDNTFLFERTGHNFPTSETALPSWDVVEETSIGTPPLVQVMGNQNEQRNGGPTDTEVCTDVQFCSKNATYDSQTSTFDVPVVNSNSGELERANSELLRTKCEDKNNNVNHASCSLDALHSSIKNSTGQGNQGTSQSSTLEIGTNCANEASVHHSDTNLSLNYEESPNSGLSRCTDNAESSDNCIRNKLVNLLEHANKLFSDSSFKSKFANDFASGSQSNNQYVTRKRTYLKISKKSKNTTQDLATKNNFDSDDNEDDSKKRAFDVSVPVTPINDISVDATNASNTESSDGPSSAHNSGKSNSPPENKSSSEQNFNTLLELPGNSATSCPVSSETSLRITPPNKVKLPESASGVHGSDFEQAQPNRGDVREGCARTNLDACLSTGNINTGTTNTTVYTSPSTLRRQRRSAFRPTRVVFSNARLRRNYFSPAMRANIILNSTDPVQENFAADEVTNYSEITNAEEGMSEQPDYHPFDPPPEYATINPENIGIGNMYSNIVGELESSLNDIRSVRASNRLGETSAMLSSFSERLESIMNQSNAILRNLHTSVDSLTPNEESTPSTLGDFPSVPEELPRSHLGNPNESPRQPTPQLHFHDRAFYLRDQNSRNSFDNYLPSESVELGGVSPNRSAVATDHTYPINPRNSQGSVHNMTPLMASLHFTLSHIQKQARLLRQQVDSIERIDRAVLEVAQVRTIMQLFVDMYRHISNAPRTENRNPVPNAGQTRAGDPSRTNQTFPQFGSGVMNFANDTRRIDNTQYRCDPLNRARFSSRYGLLLPHNYRCDAGGIVQGGYSSRDRFLRRHFSRNFTAPRSVPRIHSCPPNFSPPSLSTAEVLQTITRELEQFLMEHGSRILTTADVGGPTPTESGTREHRLMMLLNQCSVRVSQLIGSNGRSSGDVRNCNTVTIDGWCRYAARESLANTVNTICIFATNGAFRVSSVRIQLWNVIDLSLLLAEILLLQIVDSIPPPTGMNLDPQRESLSARIDQMCGNILQSRQSSGQSQRLTRSLRLIRVAVRHATRTLYHIYNTRRNAMLHSGNELSQRRQLLEEITNCLRSIRRNQNMQASNSRNAGNLSMREWYRVINNLISRYTLETPSDQPSTSGVNTNTEQTEVIDLTSFNDDSSSDGEGNHFTLFPTMDVYSDPTRSHQRRVVNQNDNEQPSTSGTRSHHQWNIPSVQINDVPVSQYQANSRNIMSRQRLSDRLSELRIHGNLFRTRYLHPLYNNPYDSELDDFVREQIYNNEIITTSTSHQRIQMWPFGGGVLPRIHNSEYDSCDASE